MKNQKELKKIIQEHPEENNEDSSANITSRRKSLPTNYKKYSSTRSPQTPRFPLNSPATPDTPDTLATTNFLNFSPITPTFQGVGNKVDN